MRLPPPRIAHAPPVRLVTHSPSLYHCVQAQKCPESVEMQPVGSHTIATVLLGLQQIPFERQCINPETSILFMVCAHLLTRPNVQSLSLF